MYDAAHITAFIHINGMDTFCVYLQLQFYWFSAVARLKPGPAYHSRDVYLHILYNVHTIFYSIMTYGCGVVLSLSMNYLAAAILFSWISFSSLNLARWQVDDLFACIRWERNVFGTLWYDGNCKQSLFEVLLGYK